MQRSSHDFGVDQVLDLDNVVGRKIKEQARRAFNTAPINAFRFTARNLSLLFSTDWKKRLRALMRRRRSQSGQNMRTFSGGKR